MGSNNKEAISHVTLGFHELAGTKWLDYSASVEEFGAERDDRWIRTRALELDTEKYAAFHNTWTGTYAQHAPPNILAKSAGDFMFLSKEVDYKPRALTCETVLDIGEAHQKLRCNATIDFLSEQYPREPSGRHPYTIGFDLPGTEIDAAAEVGRLVTQTILGYLEAPATPK